MKNSRRFQKALTDEQMRQVHALQSVFAALRQTEHGLRRIPVSVRAQVLRAIEEGVPPVVIRKACQVSWSQIKRWKPTTGRPHGKDEIKTARVLSVVEPPNQQVAASDDRIEIGIGSWRVSICRTA